VISPKGAFYFVVDVLLAKRYGRIGDILVTIGFELAQNTPIEQFGLNYQFGETRRDKPSQTFANYNKQGFRTLAAIAVPMWFHR
jgi:hypothetical protein